MLGPSDIRKVQELMLPQDDPDYFANLYLFQYRFPQICERGEILAHLRGFAKDNQADLVGVKLNSAKVLSSMPPPLSSWCWCE